MYINTVGQMLGAALLLGALTEPLGASLGPGSLASSSPQEPDATPAEIAPVLPLRRPAPASPTPVPALPDSADDMVPLTLEVITRREVAGAKPVTTHQSVLRTADRVHMSVSGGREWFFERNSVDRTRVSGSMIDHPSRSVVVFEESELRNLQGIRGWADVITMGVDLAAFSRLEVHKQRRTVSGIEFTRHLPTSPDVPMRDLWWSAEQLLPRSYTETAQRGSLKFWVTQLRRGVDGRKLVDPRSRFPDYRVLDVADWLEHR